MCFLQKKYLLRATFLGCFLLPSFAAFSSQDLKPTGFLHSKELAPLFWNCWSEAELEEYLISQNLTPHTSSTEKTCIKPPKSPAHHFLEDYEKTLLQLHQTLAPHLPPPTLITLPSEDLLAANLHQVSRKACWRLPLLKESGPKNTPPSDRTLILDPYLPPYFSPAENTDLCHHSATAPIIKAVSFFLTHHFPSCTFSQHTTKIFYSCTTDTDLSTYYVSAHQALNALFISSDFKRSHSILEPLLHEAAHYYGAHNPNHQRWKSFRWLSERSAQREFFSAEETTELIEEITDHRGISWQGLEALSLALPFSPERSLLPELTRNQLKDFSLAKISPDSLLNSDFFSILKEILQSIFWQETSPELKQALYVLAKNQDAITAKEISLYQALNTLYPLPSATFLELTKHHLHPYNSEVAADELMVSYLNMLEVPLQEAYTLLKKPPWQWFQPTELIHLPPALRLQHLKQWITRSHLSE